LMEEPEMTVGAKNVRLKCPDCDQIEQVIHISGPPERAPHCGKVLRHGKSLVAFA